MEDITALGVSLPLVAYQQLKPHLEKMKNFREATGDIAIATVTYETESFLKKHAEDFAERDERAIGRGFQRLNKMHPDRLDEWRDWHGINLLIQ